MNNIHDTISIRLVEILKKLNNSERLTIQDLALEFNVSTRTIQRDMHERFSFLPILKDNGYYYLEEYALGKLSYQDIKQFAILSGIKNLYPSLDNNFIVDLLNTRINKNYIIKGYDYEDLTNNKKEFELINIAISRQNKLTFNYNNKPRVVNPYKLVNTDGVWYLSADENGTLKTYTFSKISYLKLTTEEFKINDKFIKIIKKNKATWFSQTEIEVILHINNKVVEYFKRRNLLPKQKILNEYDSHIEVSSLVSYDEEILKIIRYWIPHIKIIKPTYLNDKLKDDLKNYFDVLEDIS